MKKFRTAVSLFIMVLSAVAGFFVGSTIDDSLGGAILFALISGISCIVYAIDNSDS